MLFLLALCSPFFGCTAGVYLSVALLQSPILLTHSSDYSLLVSFEYNDGNDWKHIQSKVICDHRSEFTPLSMWKDEVYPVPTQSVFHISKTKLMVFKNYFCKKKDLFPGVYEIEYNADNPHLSLVQNIYASPDQNCGKPTTENKRIRNWKVSEIDDKTSYNSEEYEKEHKIIYRIVSSPVKIYSSNDSIWKLSNGLDNYLKSQQKVTTAKEYQNKKKEYLGNRFFDYKLFDLRHDKNQGVTFYLTYTEYWDLEKIQKDPFLKLYNGHESFEYRYKSVIYEDQLDIFDPEIQKIFSVDINYPCYL